MICKGCGAPIPLDYQGPCPNCGQESKEIRLTLEERITIKEELTISQEMEHIETNVGWLTVTVMLTVVSALISYVLPLANPLPVVISIVFGVISIYLGDKTRRRIRTIIKQHFRRD